MSAPLPRPPRKPTPALLYETYLPALWEALGVAPQLAGAAPFTIQLQIDGLTPARWALDFSAGELRGRAGEAAGPLASIHCDAEAWRVASRDLLPRLVEHLETHHERASQEIVAALGGRLRSIVSAPGRITIDFTDDAGDVSRYEVSIGHGAGPEARIQAAERDLWLALAGKNVLTGFLKGRTELSGDVAYALRLARLLEGRV